MPPKAGPAEIAMWRSKHNPWLIALSVMLVTVLEIIDTSIVNVSLPHIAGSLSSTPQEATWVLTGYLVSNAIILCAAPWLSRYVGRKRYLFISVITFLAASALCGFATSLPMLVGARVLQGLGGGGLQPLAQAILLETFPPEERGTAMATYGMGVIVAPIIGPTLGGWITDNYSWRWLFYVNLPVGAVGLLLMSLYLEDPPYLAQQKAKRWDLIGFGLIALGIGLLQFVLDKGQEVDWFGAVWIRWTTAAAVVALATFVVWELQAAEPVMHLRLLRNRNFATGTFLMGMTGAVLFGSTALLPIFMQTLLGYSALQSGITTAPRGIGSFLSMVVVGRLVRRVDNRILMAGGFLGLAVTCWILTRLSLDLGWTDIALPLVLNGFSMGFIFVPMTTLAMSTLHQEQINQATGINSLLRNVGACIGISLLVAFQERQTQMHQVYLIARVSPYDRIFLDRMRLLGGVMHRSGGGRGAAGLVYGQVMRQSALLSYNDSFALLTGLCLVSMLMVFLFRRVHHAHRSTVPSEPTH